MLHLCFNMLTITHVRRAALRSLIPPPRLKLSEWIESNIVLPEGVSALVPKTNMTFLTTKFGAPFTSAGFGNWFRERCDEAELPQCSAHGLRKLVATRLANIGCSEEEIKAITAHKSSSEVARYTKARDQKRLAESATSKLKQARASSTESEQPLSDLPTKLDKTAAK